ncbi:hypothetical protein TWF481_008732 [Arthrobotrys musiformis]|uniref:DUF7918 domain-containing protein n=1 Tax=Arthrobotrys musiformis TaxID=47236 RepID=A0AAV9WDS9_9PEZI
MPTLRNITCNVQIDGKPLETFPGNSLGHVHECYIIADEKKPYTLNFEFGKTGSKRHCIWVRVDGQVVNSASCGESTLEIAGSRYGLYARRGQPVWEYRHLEFKKLSEIGTPGQIETSKESLNNIGTICIYVRRQHGPLEVVDEDVTENLHKYRTFKRLGSVPKKEMKKRNISHGTDISTEVSEFYDATKCSNPRDVERTDHVIFVFNYASRGKGGSVNIKDVASANGKRVEMLRKMGVLSKEQMKIDDDLVGMNMDTLQQEIMKLRNKKSTFGWLWSGKNKDREDKATEAASESEKGKLESEDSNSSCASEKSLMKKDDKKSKAKKLLCF